MAQIIQIGHNAWREVSADSAGVLVDAADYYRAFYLAAESARRYILMSGWQFDSGVPLLRGRDAPPGTEFRFLKFLTGLCERRAGLSVYLLAWDFHLVFALEREWMQRVIFHWMTHERFHFRFDDFPAAGGSHHQKYVVVDGVLAFLGGMDVCEARWDDRRHLATNALRLSRGKPTKPYHDVQAYLTGREPAATLERLFIDRWTRSGGKPLGLPAPMGATPSIELRGALPLGRTRLALSRTDPRADGTAIREVEQLYVDAIATADCLIYIETQYFSSRRICEALVQRMRAPGRPILDIVIIVNERAEALKEELAVGLRQARNLQILRAVAATTGHALGLYYSRCGEADGVFRATYIHSKLMVVDDRFLTIGSANLTNRSMGLDSELHASWEVQSDARQQRALARAIRRVRVSLLAEHGGFSGRATLRRLVAIHGLVGWLNELTTRPEARLRQHGPPTPAQVAALQMVDPQALPFDPDTSDAENLASLDEPTDEPNRRDRLAWVGRAVGSLWRRLGPRSRPRIFTVNRTSADEVGR